MLHVGLSLATIALFSGSVFAETTINGVTYGSSGEKLASSAGPLAAEQQLRLKKVFLFPSIDDVSGALAPKLDERLAALFQANPRFEFVRDPQVIKALSPDESTYYKVAQNQEVHLEAAKVTGADTTVLLRTRNVGSNTKMVLELRDAAGALLFKEEGEVPGSSTLEVRNQLISRLFNGILSRLPFEGAVTGRTANTITVDLGVGSLRQGEELEIARIISVQRHPLLGTVVGTDYSRTGKARVTTVDRVLSFAEITEEYSGERVTPGQKVLRSRPALSRKSEETGGRGDFDNRKPPKGDSGSSGDQDLFDDRLKGEFDKPKARYGVAGANLYYGSLSYNQSVSGSANDYTGSGIGGTFDGELWITKVWILSAEYGFSNANLSGTSGALGASTWKEFDVAAGYRIFPDALAEGVTLTGSIGYQVVNLTIPTSSSLSVGPKRFSGILLRADADIGFLERQKVTVGFGIQPFSSFTDTGPAIGTPSGGTVLGFHLGWNRQLTNELTFRLGIRYSVANGNYENSGSISNKRFTIGPGIYYSF